MKIILLVRLKSEIEFFLKIVLPARLGLLDLECEIKVNFYNMPFDDRKLVNYFMPKKDVLRRQFLWK